MSWLKRTASLVFNDYVGWGILGLLLICGGARTIITGDGGTYWGFPVPVAGGYIFLPLGIYILVVSIRALLRGEGKRKEPVYSPDDAARAKAELDAMYLREYGTLPEPPGMSPEPPKEEEKKKS